MATEVTALGLVDEGLQPNSVYFYLVRACNHLGCTEFSDEPVAGITESDADVRVPSAPKDVQVIRKKAWPERIHKHGPGLLAEDLAPVLIPLSLRP